MGFGGVASYMSYLTIYQHEQPDRIDLETGLPLEIGELLSDYRILYQKIPLDDDVESKALDKDYQLDLKRQAVPMDRQHQFPFATVMIVDHQYPNYDRLRMKYLSEYSLDRDEILLILEGEALLSFHDDNKVLQLLCNKGDAVIIPGGLTRWVDFGEAPGMLALMKCMQQEQDQVMHYTGSHFADFFPRLDTL